MRRYLVSLLSFLLTLSMFFSLVSCNNYNDNDDNNSKLHSSRSKTLEDDITDNDDEPSNPDISGVWVSEVDFAQLLSEQLTNTPTEKEMLKYVEFDPLQISMKLEVNEDGTFKVCINRNAIENLFATMIDNIIDGIIVMQKETFEQIYGMTFDEMLVRSNMTEDEYRHYLSSSFDRSFEFGNYNVETGEFESKGTFSFDGKNIVFNIYDGTKENGWYENGKIYMENDDVKFAFERK